MPAIYFDSTEAKKLFQKRYYGTGGYSSYGYGRTSNWHRFRWLFFLLILIPIFFLVCFWWGCKFLRRRNRRRIEDGTAPVETWDPNQTAQGGNGNYYTANQQQQLQQQQPGYDNGQYYNKEAADQHSSNFSQPTYENNNQQTGYGNTNTATTNEGVEYPNQTYQRPSGAPPGSTY